MRRNVNVIDVSILTFLYIKTNQNLTKRFSIHDKYVKNIIIIPKTTKNQQE